MQGGFASSWLNLVCYLVGAGAVIRQKKLGAVTILAILAARRFAAKHASAPDEKFSTQMYEIGAVLLY